MKLARLYDTAPIGRQVAQYGFSIKSLCVGIAHLSRKCLGPNSSTVFAKLRQVIIEEPFYSAVIEHFILLRSLRRTGARVIMERDPNFGNKYIAGFLAQSFDKKSKREILRFHYQHLSRYVRDEFYERLLCGGLVLWTRSVDGANFNISLSFDQKWHAEGDLSLVFNMNDAPLYVMSFTIVPGSVLEFGGKPALFIARVQGTKNSAEEIKMGTKACHDIAPPNLLLAAVEGMAAVVGISVLGGVGDREQLARSPDSAYYRFTYDAFWKMHSFRQPTDGIFMSEIPLPEKPLTQISAAHRRRAKNKRRVKKMIADEVAESFVAQIRCERDVEYVIKQPQ